MLFNRLDATELVVVRRLSRSRSRRSVRAAAVAINRLGDGWLYPPLLVYVVATSGPNALRVSILATTSVVVSHILYPSLKMFLGRLRPFEGDPELVPPCPPLDVFSCPSGHCMTAAAAFVPLGTSYPMLGLALLVLWFMIGWARLVLAHHYPSDLIVGAALGIGVSMFCSHLPFGGPVVDRGDPGRSGTAVVSSDRPVIGPRPGVACGCAAPDDTKKRSRITDHLGRGTARDPFNRSNRPRAEADFS